MTNIDTTKIEQIGAALGAKYAKLNEEIEAKMAVLRKEAQAVIEDMFKDFFVAVPQIKAITWTQYTPYFNDGEECTFSVNDKWFIPAGNMFDGWDEEGRPGYAEDYALHTTSYGDDPLKYTDKDLVESLGGREEVLRLGAICKSVEKLMDSIDDETYQHIWGNHVSVVVTADGIEVDEYDHD